MTVRTAELGSVFVVPVVGLAVGLCAALSWLVVAWICCRIGSVRVTARQEEQKEGAKLCRVKEERASRLESESVCKVELLSEQRWHQRASHETRRE